LHPAHVVGVRGWTAALSTRESAGIPRRDEPVTLGLPLPRGAVREPSDLRLTDAGGTALPLQAEAADRWPDGSVRWALLDFCVTVPAGAEARYHVHEDHRAEPLSPASPVRVRTTERGIFVDTGPAQFVIDRGRFAPLHSACAGGVEILEPARTGWTCRDASGREWTPEATSVEVEAAGPLRAAVRVLGSLVREGETPLLDFCARLHFHAGSTAVRLVLTVRNPRRAQHPGGFWELGDTGSVLLGDLSLSFAVASGDRISWSAEPSSPLAQAAAGPFEIYQDSSGGENWRSRNHVTRDRTVPVSFRGYRVRIDGTERPGRRATPRVAVHDGATGVCASVEHFWQNFPKAIEADDGVLTVRLFPPQFAAPHELQGGEQKTHELWLAFGAEAIDPRWDGLRVPLLVHAEPEWYAATGAIPYLTPWPGNADDLYRELILQALEGDDTFAHKRERVDEYGWRHFGELWADHEAKFHEGDEVFRSHHNNQYDAVYGFFLQFLRSGDARWFHWLRDLARHVIDIDTYHTVQDRAAYNRGFFWHTAHYVDADLSTHRTYPRRGSQGGGPDNEHNYTTGIMHYSFLTGDPTGREAVIDSARWVIARDDGRQNILRWIDRGPTGLATKTRELDYHGPGRGAGNSLNALLDAWRLTGDDSLLVKIHEILRRTIHPRDDIAARRLLDAENRWSYTVYLQALGKFLDSMAEHDRFDEHYTYARESLLAYTRWMLVNEHLILEKPEQLEYPTETWAAQDIRKSDVFQFAALHAQGEERERFLERARYFFRASLEQLADFPTKSFTRPVVILMQTGMMRRWLEEHPDASRATGPAVSDFGPRRHFVPQKTRALKKLKWAAMCGAVALAAAAVIVMLRVL
jgi:hypothetical protein